MGAYKYIEEMWRKKQFGTQCMLCGLAEGTLATDAASWVC